MKVQHAMWEHTHKPISFLFRVEQIYLEPLPFNIPKGCFVVCISLNQCQAFAFSIVSQSHSLVCIVAPCWGEVAKTKADVSLFVFEVSELSLACVWVCLLLCDVACVWVCFTPPPSPCVVSVCGPQVLRCIVHPPPPPLLSSSHTLPLPFQPMRAREGC